MPTSGEASSRCLTTVKLGETSPGREHLDGDLVSRLDLLWDSSCREMERSLGSGGQHHVAFCWPAVELCRSVVMCTWPGSWLHGMDPCTCPSAGNTARITVPVL